MISMPPLARMLLAAAVAGVLPAMAADPDPLPPPRLADLAAVADGAAADARRVTPIGRYGAARVMQLQLRAGTALPAHAAPERVLVIVLGGRGRFDFEGGQVPLRERQVLHMDPGETHGVTAETDLDLLLVRIDENASRASAAD
ncbi:MAG: cupin domain-containing protein [Luteimonas sp.]